MPCLSAVLLLSAGLSAVLLLSAGLSAVLLLSAGLSAVLLVSAGQSPALDLHPLFNERVGHPPAPLPPAKQSNRLSVQNVARCPHQFTCVRRHMTCLSFQTPGFRSLSSKTL